MKNNKFNITAILATVILLFVNIFINVLVDPYYIFKTPLIKGFNAIKPDIKKQERLTKVLEFKLHKNDIDTLFLGSSRVDYAINPYYYDKITGKKAFNFGIKGSIISDSLEFVKLATYHNPHIKTIIVGIDLFGFGIPINNNNNNKPTSDKLYYSPSIKLSEIATVLLSYDALLSSFKTIDYNIHNNNDVDFDVRGIKIEKINYSSYDEAMSDLGLYINKYVFYRDFKLCDQKIDELRKIKKICDENNINLIVFINPTNFVYLQGIKTSNNWGNYLTWKKKIAEITPFIDFSGYSNITTEKLAKNMVYYFDSNHYKSIVGDKLIDRFTEKNKVFENFGIIVTKQNVDNDNKQLEKYHESWSKHNKEVVKQINALKNW